MELLYGFLILGTIRVLYKLYTTNRKTKRILQDILAQAIDAKTTVELDVVWDKIEDLIPRFRFGNFQSDIEDIMNYLIEKEKENLSILKSKEIS